MKLCNVSDNLRNDNNGRKSGTNQQKPQFGLRWKMFELDGCEVGSESILRVMSVLIQCIFHNYD